MTTTDEIVSVTLKNRINKVFDELSHELNLTLYGDTIKWDDRPLSWRIKFYWLKYSGRMLDAWAVLIGKAEIGDSW